MAQEHGAADQVRVLLIDDDDAAYALARALLEKADSSFTLDWASTYEEGLAQIERNIHDAYLLDYHLGARNGIDLLRAAVDLGCQAPIIMLSGRTDSALDREAMRAGAAGYLEKVALAPRQLVRTVRYAVETSRAVRELQVFRSAVEQSTDCIVVASVATPGATRIEYVNPAFLRATGFRSEELAGRSLRTLMPNGELPVEMAAAEKSGWNETTTQGESILRRQDSTEMITEWRQTPIRDDSGHITHLVTCFRDVSERRQLETCLIEADRLASIGVLASGVSHEINNPLAYVLPNLSFALEELKEIVAAPSAERLQQIITSLEEAREGAERVRDIVRDLHMFSRVDHVQESPTDLIAVLEKALVMTMNETRRRGRVIRELAPVPQVKVNEGQLAQVFISLIVNAARSLDSVTEDKSLRVATRTNARGQAVIEFHDTGRAIASEHVAKLFNPFFSVRPSEQGVGLNLAVCHSVLSRMGGEIEVETGSVRGNIFRVTLPGCAAPPVVEVASVVARKRVLVVDDEPLIGGALGRGIGPEYEVEAVTSAAAVLERLERGERYDVILCDLIMPDVTGMELFDEIGRTRPELRSRFVFVSGGAYTERAAQFLEQFPNRRLAKPFEMRELRTILREMTDVAAPMGGTADRK